MTLDPQHVAEHNLMVANLHAQCARFGLTPTSGGPYTVGDPDHIGEHGRYLDDLLMIETTAGRTFTKPIPNANPVHGQTGHITDHEDLNAWIAEASTWPAWNDATGGTVTEIADGQYPLPGRWRIHTFSASSTLDISLAVQPFRVLVVAGGGANGAGPGDVMTRGGGGAGGLLSNDALTLTTGAHTVTVGAAGVYIGSPAPSGSGGDSAAFGLSATGGGYGADNAHQGGNGGSGGGGSSGSNFNTSPGNGIAGQGHAGRGGGGSTPGGGGGAGGAATSNTGGPGVVSDINGSAVEYAQGGVGGGGSAKTPTPGSGNPTGTAVGGEPGIVIVAYRIG